MKCSEKLKLNLENNVPIITLIVIGIGVMAGITLLFALYLPNKYAMPLALGVIGAPITLIFRNKEKLMAAAYLFLLPVSMGYMLLENLEVSYSKAPYVFKFWISDIFLISLVFIQLVKKISKAHSYDPPFLRNRLILPFLLWFGMGVVSLIPAIDRTATLVGIYRMVRIFLVYFCFFHYVKGWRDVQFIIKCLLYSVLFQSLLMFAQYITGTLVLPLSGMHPLLDMTEAGFRPSGTLGHSGHFAKFSMLILPMALSLSFFARRTRDKIFSLAVWICGTIALILTVSRLGVGTWLISLFLLLGGSLWLQLVSTRQAWHLCLLIFVLVPILFMIGGNRLENRLADDQGSAAVRLPMARVALNIIKIHPILGVGLLNYTVVQHKYDDTREQITVELPDLPVHNLFLLYAAELGIPGLLSFLWFVWWLSKDSLYCARHAHSPAEKVIYLSITIGLAALLAQSLAAMGVADNLIHLSVVVIFAACVTKQRRILKNYQAKSLAVALSEP